MQILNDSELTYSDINKMDDREFKNFENRLRSRAKQQGVFLSKSNHPSFGALYLITDNETHFVLAGSIIGLCIEEVRDWIHGF